MIDQRPSITIAASACLLGQEVRYDGGHKRHHHLCTVISERFAIIPVCPEVELGLAIPREPMEVVDIGGELRLRGSRSGTDHSHAMREYAHRRISKLDRLGICGYVLKSGSPSCAVLLRTSSSGQDRSVQIRGLFAHILITRLPGLPIVEEDQLDRPVTAHRFIDTVIAYHRLAKSR